MRYRSVYHKAPTHACITAIEHSSVATPIGKISVATFSLMRLCLPSVKLIAVFQCLFVRSDDIAANLKYNVDIKVKIVMEMDEER